MKKVEIYKYWRWLLKGDKKNNVAPGIRMYWNWWLVAHVAVGILLAYFATIKPSKAACTILLPLAGIFIGLAFAMASNSIGLLQTTEIGRLVDLNGGIEKYTFKYQTSVLIVLICLVSWGVAGLEIFDFKYAVSVFVVKSFLYSFSSFTIRECWQVILGTQYMLITRDKLLKNLPSNVREK